MMERFTTRIASGCTMNGATPTWRSLDFGCFAAGRVNIIADPDAVAQAIVEAALTYSR